MQAIYFSTSVRGARSNNISAIEMIEILQMYGKVLTAKLGLRQVDSSSATDSQIWAEDMQWLSEATCFVADVTNPSLGVGYMIAKAVERKIPVLVLYNTTITMSISAMINGDPNVTKMQYHDLGSWKSCIGHFFQNQRFPISFLIMGPPGAGKSTVTKALNKLHVTGISTGEMLRNLDPQNELYGTIHKYMDAGKLVPSEYMYRLVKERLDQTDCKSGPFCIDGYPPSFVDLQNLKRMGYNPTIVFYFACSSDVAIARQCERKARNTDTRELAAKRIEEYQQNIPNVGVVKSEWFPESTVIEIDAEQPMETVLATVESIVSKCLENYYSIPAPQSFFPIPPKMVHSDKFHGHIDAPNCNMIYGLCMQLINRDPTHVPKIYPIQYLQTGPQSIAFDGTKLGCYGDMLNFHTIENSDTESFVTCDMGSKFNDTVMKNMLTVACKTKSMVEVEQYIGKWNMLPDFTIETVVEPNPVEFNTKLQIQYPEFESNRIQNSPPVELHFGFNLPKTGAEPPINLTELVNKCNGAGMTFGGVFIFHHPTEWRFRTNEFRMETVQECINTIMAQAPAFQKIIQNFGFQCVLGFSIEIVHGIWVFNK